MLPAISTTDTLRQNTGSWSYVIPVHQDNTPPCSHACPAGVDVNRFIQLILAKKHRDAWEVLRESNPFPSVCGRVCYGPCEINCNRNAFDEPVSIRNLERFAGDWGSKNVPVKRMKTDPSKGDVAIVGAGPAGLSCAYHLIRKGYPVTVFDSMPKAGGMLRAGIPEYRLPRRVLDAEIKSILDLGVKFRGRTKVGSDIDFSELRKYSAVFVAVGRHKSRDLGIPGETISGVVSGRDFLREVNLGDRPTIRGKVAIIGGDNTAIDVARCVLRLGGKPVVFYSRSYEEMPAIRDEIREAEYEGTSMEFLSSPIEIRKRGRMLSLTVQKMKLGGKDEKGRRRLLEIKGSETVTPFRMIITAIGAEPNLDFLPDEIRRSRFGIDVDDLHQTSVPAVFAGGDACGTDKRAVAVAVGVGLRAAQAIDEFISKRPLSLPETEPTVTHATDLRLDYFEKKPAVSTKKTSDAVRLKSFREVRIGLSEKEAVEEAKRCFSCGTCNACDNCWTFCPDTAIKKSNGKYVVNYSKCKGCGICVNECPRHAIHLESKHF